MSFPPDRIKNQLIFSVLTSISEMLAILNYKSLKQERGEVTNLAMIENELFETSSFGKDFYFVIFFPYVPYASHNVDDVTLFFPCKRLRDNAS